VQLAQLGAPLGYLDVGGGPRIDLRRPAATATAASTNYSLQELSTDVVADCRECCAPTASPANW